MNLKSALFDAESGAWLSDLGVRLGISALWSTYGASPEALAPLSLILANAQCRAMGHGLVSAGAAVRDQNRTILEDP
jgi:hypothetical protein